MRSRRAIRVEALLCVSIGAVGLVASGALAPPERRVAAGGMDSAHSGLIVSQKVGLQHASKAELVMLPKIGPVLASRIVEARGRRCLPDLGSLTEIKGIGPATVQALEPYGYIGCAP